jgi:iron complex transport system substrate-binding protein
MHLLTIIKKINILIPVFSICMLISVETSAKTVIDHVGRRVSVPDNPQKIIALAPSITEVIYDLGEEHRLRGVTQYSDFPAQAKTLPRVGSYVRLDLEKIIALEPDLCLAIKDGNPKHIIDKIVALDIPVYVIDPRSLDHTMDTITLIGSLLNAEQAALKLVAEMQSRIARVETLVRKANHRPRIFFQIDAEPLISAGNNTFIDELIELAGGINTAAGKDPYPRYSWEDILILQPEMILISSMAGGLNPEQLVLTWKKWDQLAAVINDQIFVVDADLFDRPTPRLVDGLELIAEIIHPELFEQKENSGKSSKNVH